MQQENEEDEYLEGLKPARGIGWGILLSAILTIIFLLTCLGILHLLGATSC